MANPTTGIPQYDAIRQRLKSQYTQARQDQTDAIQRRFAANGMAGSGAYGKAQDQANEQVGKAEADATAQLDFQEANELQRRKELDEGRQFQTSERVGAQQFNEGMFNKDLDLKKQQFDAQKDQFAKEFAENQNSNRASLYANLIGDDANDPEKVKTMWDQVNAAYKGDTAPPTVPKKPLQSYRDAFGHYYTV
jgi:hypothetical protein